MSEISWYEHNRSLKRPIDFFMALIKENKAEIKILLKEIRDAEKELKKAKRKYKENKV